MRPEPSDTLLDVGGGVGISGEFRALYEYFSTVVVANIEKHLSFDGVDTRLGGITADGCLLPLPQKSFDYVFCNAVIEHVGRRDRQALFARELCRVAGKGYFVATPNRHFPVDPHTFLPFYHLIPARLQKLYVRISPGHLRDYEELNLLSSKAFRKLFPEAEIVALGPSLMPINLVALWKGDRSDSQRFAT